MVRRAGLEDDFVGSTLDLLLRKYLTPSSFANSFSRLPDEGRGGGRVTERSPICNIRVTYGCFC